MNPTPYLDTVTRYLALLEAGDVNGMAALFSPTGQVFSPFLGWMSPRPFFTEVVGASGQSRIETLDILVSVRGAPRAIGYFIYHWQLKDGTFVDFHCADVFDFDAQGRIERMTIVYDTHPVRAQVGNKYG
jgi:SnoaL-like domain